MLPINSDFVRGTAAIRTLWRIVIDMGLNGASLETIELEAHGDTAIEIGRCRLLAVYDAVGWQSLAVAGGIE